MINFENIKANLLEEIYNNVQNDVAEFINNMNNNSTNNNNNNNNNNNDDNDNNNLEKNEIDISKSFNDSESDETHGSNVENNGWKNRYIFFILFYFIYINKLL